jgi:hypothetical protein
VTTLVSVYNSQDSKEVAELTRTTLMPDGVKAFRMNMSAGKPSMISSGDREAAEGALRRFEERDLYRTTPVTLRSTALELSQAPSRPLLPQPKTPPKITLDGFPPRIV